MSLTRLRALPLSLAVLSACAAAGDSETDGAECSPAAESQMRATLASVATDTDFAFYLESADGRRFAYDRGNARLTTSFESASTSKWVTAAVILRLVDRGVLSLDSRPQDLIDGWDVAPSDSLSRITLAQLLSFTSGLVDEPLCINLPNADFETCVLRILDVNRGNGRRPGAEFYYGSAHMQVAGLMAVRASRARDWEEVFSRFRAETGLFPTGRYDLPSAANPRLAGGMHWTGNEYAGFLRALRGGPLLSSRLRDEMFRDQIAGAQIVQSPASARGEDWHYGLGNWLECRSRAFNCTAPAYRSSPGAYGAYPFLNLSLGFFGIVARQGLLGTGFEGTAVYELVRGPAETWATCQAE